MKPLAYLALAVELVEQVESLLVHRGSKHALALARAIAKGKAVDTTEIGLARAQALASLKACAGEARDGRAPAAEAAWQLLAPDIKEWLQSIAENVAKALAAKTVVERRGSLSTATQDEFDYVRAVQLELMMDRVGQLKEH